MLYGGAKGGGKLQQNTALIYTPFGSKQIGSAEVGDQVCNPDGSIAQIIGVYPQGTKDLYRVTFNDGASTVVGLEHLWLVRFSARKLKAERKYFPFRNEESVLGKIVTTKQILSVLQKWENRERDEYGNGRPAVLVPLTNPVVFTPPSRSWSATYPLDAYCLGLLLGDGSLTHSLGYSGLDLELVAALKEGLNCNIVRSGRPQDWRFIGPSEIISKLKHLGLYGHKSISKFIPEKYKHGPLEVRWSILQGLMDTDGYVDSRGHCSYTSVSEQLAKDVQFVARSLGFRASLNRGTAGYKSEGEFIRCNDAFDVHLSGRNTKDLFRLQRKKARCHDNFNGPTDARGHTVPMRRIDSIEFVGRDEATCIAVDHPNGLYLTDDFIVTHNTEAGTMFCLGAGVEGWKRNGYQAILFRKTFSDLELHVIPRSRALFSGMGRYDDRNHRWKFRTPDGGESYLYFGYLQYESDVHKYSGSQFARMFFDESNMMRESMVRYMLGSLRSAVAGVSSQAALGANPIGAGFGWHKKLFVEKRKRMKIYRDALWPSDHRPVYDPISKWGSTCFIPARVWDNPVLLKNDPGYPGRLRTQMGAVTDALLEGSWDRAINLAVENWDELLHTRHIKSADNPQGVELADWGVRWIGVDYGKTNAASAVWAYSDHKRVVLYRDYTVKNRDVVPFAHDVLDRCVDQNHRREDITCVVLSHELFADVGTMRSRAQQFMEVFQKANIPVIQSGRDPRGRLTLIREMLRTEPLAPGIISPGSELDFDFWEKEFRKRGAEAWKAYLELTQGRENEELPKMLILQPTPDEVYGCPDIIRNWPLLMCQTEPHPDPFVLAEGQEDDSWDGAGYALQGWMGLAEKPVLELYRERMAGRMPESPLAADLMQKAIAEELEGEGECKPVRWEKEPFEG